MIDYIFNLIINKSDEISDKLYQIINKLEFNYTKDIIEKFKEEKIQMIKEIIFVLYELEKENFNYIIDRVKRDDLINWYNLCKIYETDNFISYYKKTIINNYNK